ncbi:hypothetical protein ACWEKM_13000 [Streptomyces sp. NPDC004752]
MALMALTVDGGRRRAQVREVADRTPDLVPVAKGKGKGKGYGYGLGPVPAYE